MPAAGMVTRHRAWREARIAVPVFLVVMDDDAARSALRFLKPGRHDVSRLTATRGTLTSNLEKDARPGAAQRRIADLRPKQAIGPGRPVGVSRG